MTIYMDTIKSSRYPDTDAMFVPPTSADIVIRSFAQADRIPTLLKE